MADKENTIRYDIRWWMARTAINFFYFMVVLLVVFAIKIIMFD